MSIATLHAVQGRLLEALDGIPEISDSCSSVWRAGRNPATDFTGIEIFLYRGGGGDGRGDALEAAAAIIGGTIAPLPGRPFPVSTGWRRLHELRTHFEDVPVHIQASRPSLAPETGEA